MKKFTEFQLHPDLQKGIDSAGFVHCTPVQEETFAAIFAGRDVTVKSQTGTGKTAAFLISIFQTLLDERETRRVNGSSEEIDQVLILAPTRELVVQIEEEAQVLGEFLDFKFSTVYGGVGYNKQEAELANNPNLIIATPGRLLDFIQSRKIDLRRFGYLIIDEADRMFDMGFYPDIQKILRGMKAPAERRTLLFSATLGTRVLNIAWEHMNDPVDIEIEPEHVTVDAIDQTLYHVSRDEKISLLLGLINKHKPESAVFFTNTKRMAEELSNRLRANNFTAEFIMGDLPQKKRLNIINAVKNKEIRFLVATDVAARGLHIDDLAMVFNYDLPEDSENYVHRIGRTARAGNTGKAISLADEHSVYNLSSIESYINMKIPTEPVTEDLLAEDLSRGKRFHSEYSRGGNGGRRDDNRRGGRSGSSSGNRSRSRSGGRDGNRDDRRNTSSSRRDERQPSNSGGGNNRKNSGGNRRSGSRGGNRGASKDVSKMSEQDRLEYYANKYGEDFALKDSSGKTKKSAKAGNGGNRQSSDDRQSGGNSGKSRNRNRNRNNQQNQNRQNSGNGQSQQGGKRGKGPAKGKSQQGNSGKGQRPKSQPAKGKSGSKSDSNSAAGKKGGVAGFFRKLFGGN